jgi:UDP-N-acetyl-D-galactosamine dehydrogenase
MPKKKSMHEFSTVNIAIIGLGYVGLPLAVEFSKHFPVVGFDHNIKRITELRNGQDSTLELTGEELEQAKRLQYSMKITDLKNCNVYIVTVPTPIDEHKNPDIHFLIEASKTVGTVLKYNDVVIYESTVYPGATEGDCVPVLEAYSNLRLNQDFYVGYSPERINPGDKSHRLQDIKKVTSGSTSESAEFIDMLYKKIIKAGTHQAPSIKVAEAAKVIENTQRDLNIALINELAIIFNKMQIDTEAVLEAAGTKWNFLPFRPGLVGGHCISVDPYYLTHKAQSLGYQPKVILAGRCLNDGMGTYVADQLVKALVNRGISPNGANILVMGLTFKENCPDIRNSRVVDILIELKKNNCIVNVYDPWVSAEEAQREYGIHIESKLSRGYFDAIVLAVAHQQFKDMGAAAIRALGKSNVVLYDLKYVLTSGESDLRL